ncbi:MAG: AfsR/SARP family transcriptional regulator, partial [Nocardioides sp.]
MEVVGDGRVTAVTGPRRRSLLAALALELGQLVSVDRIIDAVWDDAPPLTARNTVQVHVAALRKVLGTSTYLVSRPPGYVLQLPAPGTDLASVHHLLAEAANADGPHDRVGLLEAVLDHWSGPTLADIAPSTYLSGHAASLEDLRTTTRERLLADRLRLGQHRAAIPELERMGHEHPFRERPVRMLMVAFYRDGRTRDAL